MVRVLVGVGMGKSTIILRLLSRILTPTRANPKRPKPSGRIPAKAGEKVMRKGLFLRI